MRQADETFSGSLKMSARKIIHVDMDAFYASVELLARPALKGQPVVVAWEGARSVVCAASYEARAFGLRSAMSCAKARQLCPQAVFIPPDFHRYRAVSGQIHGIFQRYASLVEPLSLDEAYLDVTHNTDWPSATAIAQAIRADIAAQTGLTASAGVAPNKFLAKIASDWNKPDGIFVVAPRHVAAFLQDLPLEKVPGVGRATLKRLHALGLYNMGDMQRPSLGELVLHFGRYGYRLHDLARGVDHRPVKPERKRVQISTETTLSDDVLLEELRPMLPALCKDLFEQLQKKACQARTVTLKLKTDSFQTLTRSLTFSSALQTQAQWLEAAQQLFTRVEAPDARFRLIGLGASQLTRAHEPQQLAML